MRDTSRRHFVGSVAAAFLGGACAVQQPSPNPAASRASSSQSLSSESRQWAVVDHASRWASSVRARRSPSVTTEAGYSRVVIDVGATHSVNCFIYDAPLVMGEALTRLLDAAETGIAYRTTTAHTFDALGETPFVVLSAHFTTTMAPHGEAGALHVAIVPRVKHPGVCSHEEAGGADALTRVAREFLGDLEPPSTFLQDTVAGGDRPLASELWLLKREGQPIGFRQWRASQNEEGAISTLEVSTTIEPRAAGITTTDTSVAEQEDTSGLQSMRLVELQDGEPRVRLGLQRTGIAEAGSGMTAHTYELAGVGTSGPLTGSFRSQEAIQSSYAAFASWFRDEDREASYLLYLPGVELRSATRVAEGARSADGVSQTVGGSEFIISLGEHGLPTGRRATSSPLESTLLVRTIVERALPKERPPPAP